MTVPCDLDNEERGPGVQQQWQRWLGSPVDRDAADDPSGSKVTTDPEQLHEKHAGSDTRDQEEGDLSQWRIDRRDRRVVDQTMPDGSEAFDLGGPRGEEVGVQARQLHVPVPQIPIEVVGEAWGQWQQRDPARDGYEPDRWQREGFVRLIAGDPCRHHVDRECEPEDGQAWPRERMHGREPCQRRDYPGHRQTVPEQQVLLHAPMAAMRVLLS